MTEQLCDNSNLINNLLNNNEIMNDTQKNLNQINEESNCLIDELWKLAENEILPMLYSLPSIGVKVSINGNQYFALLDTGAEANVINKKIIDECNLNDYVDKRIIMSVKGIGQNNIIGCIPYLNVNIHDYEYPVNFNIMKDIDFDIILGQSFMMFYKAKLDFEKRKFCMSDIEIPLIIRDH